MLAGLPPESASDLLSEIQARVAASRRKVVVLDDDPTGTQTIHGLPVLTEWAVESLRAELEGPHPAFFILTNSRSLSLPQAQALNAEIGRRLVAAAEPSGADFVVISRSDSTLRGHFPGEVRALADGLGQNLQAWLLIPFFLEGGRYTVDDVHYVAEGETLVPAGQTEFAQDAAFGYQASNLCEWVAEKTERRVRAEAVRSISLDDIRRGGPSRVADRLSRLGRNDVCVVNAVSYRDLETFTLGLLEVEAQGHRFLCRTAASFVRVRCALPARPLLTRDDLDLSSSMGALFVVGSYVGRTTCQVETLLRNPDIVGVEVNVCALLDDHRRAAEIERAASRTDEHLARGRDVGVFTSRTLRSGPDAEESLAIGRRVSAGLVAIVESIRTRPRYLVAKGGITSSDLAVRALGVRRAIVCGQILPGVPVWQLGPESRCPGLIYIVFPGNVGEPGSLAEIAAALRRGHVGGSARA